eukprot:scaffold71094_cov33-Prasinocladus_malaysianus.AAC.1
MKAVGCPLKVTSSTHSGGQARSAVSGEATLWRPWRFGRSGGRPLHCLNSGVQSITPKSEPRRKKRF